MKKILSLLVFGGALLLTSCGGAETSKATNTDEPNPTTSSKTDSPITEDKPTSKATEEKPIESTSSVEDEIQNVTVKFIDTTQKFTGIYMWEVDGAPDILGVWPGSPMVNFEFETTLTVNQRYGLIFNGDSGQTGDMFFSVEEASTVKYLGDNQLEVIGDSGQGQTFEPVIPEEVDVTFVDGTQSFKNLYVWEDGGDPILGNWPGAALSEFEYLVSLEVGVTYGFIFNGDEGQTADLKVRIEAACTIRYTGDNEYIVE